MSNKVSFLIPAYNHKQALELFLPKVMDCGLHCIIVNDGSTDGTIDFLNSMKSKHVDLEVIHRDLNEGKGRAVCDGFAYAAKKGFTHVIQIDADGQHDLSVIPKFIEGIDNKTLVLGYPVFDQSVPWVRKWGRKISTLLVWIETLSFAIKDPLCGYRVYPVKECLALSKKHELGQRMDFDLDILVKLWWEGVRVKNIPVKVVYPETGVSHFHYIKDNLRIALVHISLLAFLPVRLIDKLQKRIKKGKETQEWSSVKEKGNYLGLRLMFFLYRVLGKRLCLIFLHPVIFYYFITSSHARKASKKYLKLIEASPEGKKHFPNGLKLTSTYKHLYEFGRCLIDKIAAWYGDIPISQVDWIGKDSYRSVIYQGQGTILLSAHLGNLEVMRALAEELPNLTINALMFTQHAAHFTRLLKSSNPDSHLKIIPLESISAETIMLLQEKIADGEVISMLGDRVSSGSRDKYVTVDFLGKPAKFPIGPFILASLLNCPVYTVFCLRESENNYSAYFEHFKDAVELPRGNREQALEGVVQQFAKRVETYCLKQPMQWFNFYEFWEDEEPQNVSERFSLEAR